MIDEREELHELDAALRSREALVRAELREPLEWT